MIRSLVRRLPRVGDQAVATGGTPSGRSVQATETSGPFEWLVTVPAASRFSKVVMKTLAWYLLAALGEIGGCYAFWAWLRMHKSPLWVAPGLVSLVVFALALTRIDAAAAGRAYAAYGGIYIISSIAWLWLVEGVDPDGWDLSGAGVCLLGAGIILLGHPKG